MEFTNKSLYCSNEHDCIDLGSLCTHALQVLQHHWYKVQGGILVEKSCLSNLVHGLINGSSGNLASLDTATSPVHSTETGDWSGYNDSVKERASMLAEIHF